MSMYAKHQVSPAKAAVVEEMKEKLQSAQGAVFVGFSGLSVADVRKSPQPDGSPRPASPCSWSKVRPLLLILQKIQ